MSDSTSNNRAKAQERAGTFWNNTARAAQNRAQRETAAATRIEGTAAQLRDKAREDASTAAVARARRGLRM